MAAGTLLGIALALVLGSLLSSLLFGVQPIDPSVLCGAALLFTTVGLLGARAPRKQD